MKTLLDRDKRKPKIWYFLPELRLGGTEKHVIRLASGLRRRGYETGIALIFREGILSEEARHEGIPLVSFETGNMWNLKTFFQIFNWLHSNPMDILHTYLFGFHLFVGLPARLSGVPILLSSRRGRAVGHWEKRRHRWVEKLGNFFVDQVTCCSEESQRWVLRHEHLPPEKVRVIHNGIDLKDLAARAHPSMIRQEWRIPKEAFLVGTVANFSPEKGYSYLLEAAELILKKKSNTWFLFVGSGPLEAEIKKRVQGMEGGKRIIFTGSRHDIPDLIGAMDVFVLASVIEGFPNVLLEAMGMAEPVVATEVGGIPELIDPGETGLLVPPKDGRALSEAVLSLLEDRNKAYQMGLRAQQKIRRDFTQEKMLDQYEAFYLSLLRSKVGWVSERKEAVLSV